MLLLAQLAWATDILRSCDITQGLENNMIKICKKNKKKQNQKHTHTHRTVMYNVGEHVGLWIEES